MWLLAIASGIYFYVARADIVRDEILILSAQEPAYAGDMIRMPDLEVFGELQALRKIVEASGRHEDPADREQEVNGRGQEQQAERNQVGHRNQLFERPLTERRASFRLYYPTMAGRYFPTGRK